MKKLSIILITVLLIFTFTACSSEGESGKEAEVNPLLGTWEAICPSYEASFTFNEGESGVVGSYKYYDYIDSTWGEFGFTLKEQSEDNIVLLVDEGTIDTMKYKVIGNHLYIDGLVFTNAEAEEKEERPLTSIVRMSEFLESEKDAVYGDIFMGMHVSDVEEVMGKEIELTAYNDTRNEYRFTFTCDYYGYIHGLKGDYYVLNFGFDENYRLVSLQKQTNLNKEEDIDLYNSALEFYNTKLGLYDLNEEYDDEEYGHFNVYYWYEGEYVVEFKSNTDQYFTVMYYYNPAQ